MERDSLIHSEFNPPPKSDENTSSTETDKKKTKKTQSDNEKVWSRVNSPESKSDDKPKQSETLNTLWRRTIEEAKKADTKELPPAEESISEDQLDHLSQAEVKEVAEAYLMARRQEIAQELTGDIDDEASESDEQAALAADTYLAAVESKLRTDPEVNITDATDQAYHEAVQSYIPENNPVSPAEESNGAGDESLYNQGSAVGRGDSGREPPSWRGGGFAPEGRYSFGSTSANTGGNLETIVERDFAAERVATVRGLLIGGIIGYLIGRRRGRIKTEKRLIPIQKKLEREVGSLYTTISVKETQIRKLVSERDHSLKFTASETTARQAQPLSYESESRTINQKQSNPESLRTSQHHSAEVVNPPISKVEVVNRENLLVAGEKITVGSTTLRKVFETGLISERGLRRAVEEYAKGGDIRRVLAEEVLIKELGYELDPLMRDRPLRRTTAPLTSSATQKASHDQAAAVLAGKTDPTSPYVDVSPLPQIPDSPHGVPSQLIAANVIALIVLAVLVLILLITHK